MEQNATVGRLRLVRWAPISGSAEIPPLGKALRAHIEAYTHPGGRAASTAAWALLYETLLAQGLPPAEVAFTPKGKPFFPGSSVWFSLSHADRIAAVSLADVPTGVDVERCDRPVRPELAARCRTEAESAAFGGDFFRLWCRKECLVKLTGAGLSGFPRDVNALDPRCEFREEILRTETGVYRLTAAFSLEKQFVDII